LRAAPVRRLEQKGRDAPGRFRLLVSDDQEHRETQLNPRRTGNSSAVQAGETGLSGAKKDLNRPETVPTLSLQAPETGSAGRDAARMWGSPIATTQTQVALKEDTYASR